MLNIFSIHHTCVHTLNCTCSLVITVPKHILYSFQRSLNGPRNNCSTEGQNRSLAHASSRARKASPLHYRSAWRQLLRLLLFASPHWRLLCSQPCPPAKNQTLPAEPQPASSKSSVTLGRVSIQTLLNSSASKDQ